MSDTSQGPGWWQASDGKWYSPEQVPAGSPAPDQTAYGSPHDQQQGAPQPGYGYGGPQPGWGGPPASGGQPGYGYTYGYPPGQQFSNGIGTAAMVLGIISLVCFWFWGVTWVLSVLAITFGLVGIGKANRGEANNKGMAVAGLVCGALVAAFWIVILIVVIATRS